MVAYTPRGEAGAQVGAVSGSSLSERLRQTAAQAQSAIATQADAGARDADRREQEKAQKILAGVAPRAEEVAQRGLQTLPVMDIDDMHIDKKGYVFEKPYLKGIDHEVAHYAGFPLHLFKGAVRIVAEELLRSEYGFRLSVRSQRHNDNSQGR